MQIQTVQDTRDGEVWRVTYDGGVVHGVPKNMNNRHARQVQEWIDAGGVVGPYVPPVPPTDDEQIDKQGRIFKAFLKSYAKRMGITPAQLRADIKAEL